MLSPPAPASRALIQRSLLRLLGRHPRAATPQFGSGSGNSAPSQSQAPFELRLPVACDTAFAFACMR